MGLFSAPQLAALAGKTVRAATLCDFDFDGQPTYLWNGFGEIVIASKTYLGAGESGAIEGLEDIRLPESQRVTFTLSGVSDGPADLLSIALDDTDIVQGRSVTVYQAFFDDAWAAIGDPVAIYQGIMQQPRVTRERMTEGGGARVTISLPAENLFFARARPPAGRYTAAEQNRRFAGDKFCDATAMLANATFAWPDY